MYVSLSVGISLHRTSWTELLQDSRCTRNGIKLLRAGTSFFFFPPACFRVLTHCGGCTITTDTPDTVRDLRSSCDMTWAPSCHHKTWVTVPQIRPALCRGPGPSSALITAGRPSYWSVLFGHVRERPGSCALVSGSPHCWCLLMVAHASAVTCWGRGGGSFLFLGRSLARSFVGTN